MARAERTRKSGFSLRLEQGQGRLVLTERRVGDLLFVEQLHLALRHVPARLDMTEGVERFRHAYTRLDQLAVAVDDQELASLLRTQVQGTALRELDLRVLDGDLVVAGEVFDGVPFVCRVRLEPASVGGERALLVSVYEVRVFGPCRAAGPEVATMVLQAAELAEHLAGPTCAVFDPVDRLAAEIFGQMGWKLPDRSGLRLTEARVEAGRVRIVAGRVEPNRGGLRSVTAPESPTAAMRYRRFLADYEAKTLYAALEADVAAGRIERAAAAYERQLELHPEHPFIVARLLQLWQARAETRAEADSLARAHLERYADDLDALVTLAVVQQSQGNAVGAAELYRRVARIAERQGDTIEAAQALCAVARALAPRDPSLAIEALERALALRRRLPGALRALADLYERAGNIAGAIQARERLLAAEAPGAVRLGLLLDLGRLTLERAGDAQAAASWFERLIEESPEEVDAWLGLASAHEMSGRLLPAVRALDRAAVLLQQRGEARWAARVLVRLGDLWKDLPEGGAATAALRYRQALLLEPALPAALLGLAEAAASEGDARRARTHLEELLRLGNQTPGGERVEAADRIHAHLRLGHLYAEALADPQQAIGHYQKCLDGTPDQLEEALGALEALFTALGRFDDLARVLEMAAERATEPSVKAARLVRLAGVLRDSMSDLRRAASLLAEATRLQPGRTDYLRSLVDLQRRRGDAAAAAEALLALTQVVEAPAELAVLYAERADLLRHKLNRADEAAETWSLALGCDPACLPALEGLADIYRERERFPELAALLGRWAALESDPDTAAQLYLELGRLNRTTLQRPEHAREAYEKALVLAPKDAEALRGVGDLFFEMGRPAQAATHYERLLAVYEAEGFDEAPGPFLSRMAVVCERLHRDAEAVTLLERARDLDSERIDVYEAAQDLLLRAGDLEAIVTFFEQGLERARRAETRAFLARRAGRLLWRELRRPADAAPRLDEAAKLLPDDLDVATVRLEVATALGDWPKVAALLRSRLDRAPASERPALLTRLAELAFGALSRPDEGIDLARGALQEDPTYVPALALLAERAFAAADWRAAGQAYEQLLALEGEAARPEDRMRLAITRMYSGRPADALPVLLSLRRAGERLPDLVSTLAEACLQATDATHLGEVFDDRLAECTTPATREGFLRRAAEVFERAGETARALDAWDAVLASRPGDAEAQAALERLRPPPPPAEPSIEPTPTPAAVEPETPPEPVEAPLAPPEPVKMLSPYRTVGPSTTSPDASEPDARRERLLAQARALEATATAAVDAQESATQWLALGELYRDDLHDPDSAEIAFAEVMTTATAGGAAWCAAEEALEEIYGARNDWPALVALYDARLDHGVGDRAELLVLKASVLRLAGEVGAAIAAAESAGADERARELLVALHEAAGQPERAAHVLTLDLDALPPDEAAQRRWRAATLLSRLEPGRACALFADAAATLTDATLAEEWLTCARLADDALAIVDALEGRAAAHGAVGPESMRRSRLLFEASGIALQRLQDTARARGLLERSLAAWADNVEALERLADVLETLGDGDALAACLEQQIAAALPGPWRGKLGLRLARVHGEMRGDRVAAERSARTAADDLAGTPDIEALALWLAPTPLPAAATPAPLPGEPRPARPTRDLPMEPARRHERLLTEPGTSLGERASAWRALVEIRTRVPDLQRLLGLLETRLLAATDAGEQATLHALAGELWRGRLGNTERARAEFDRAIALDTGSPRAHLGLGILEMDRGHLDTAVDHLFHALVNRGPAGGGLLAEEELAAFHRFRRALAQLGRTDQLVVQAERLLEANPASRPALDAVDGALSQRREWGPLLAHYARALAASDEGRRNARLWRRQAEILQATGDGPAALRALAEAVRVHPDDVHTRIASLRLAHQLGDAPAIVLHGEALLLLPIERWLSAVESDPEWLRHPEALRRTVADARASR